MKLQNLIEYRQLLAAQNWCESGEILPEHIAEWLLYRNSLTEKLQQICPNLTVEIVSESWQAGSFGENSAKQWVREVLLKCGDTAWIFAQTILPEVTIQNVADSVLELGEKPIGLWLFPQNPTRLSLAWQKDLKTDLFSRYSRLSLKGYPIEIKELFLSDFPFGNNK